MLIIDNDVVSKLLTMADCIRVQEEAFKKLPTGGAIHRPRIKGENIPATVPLAVDLAKNADQREAIELFLSRATLGRPFVTPPSVPLQRIETLRRAFDATMKDAEFVAEAKKAGLTVDPMTGEKLAEMIADIYRTPKHVVKRVAETLGRVSK